MKRIRRRIVLQGLCVFVGVIAIVTYGYLSGRWIPNNPRLDDYPVRGIDVSHHQGVIQWGKVSSSGVAFAYIKATEGGDFIDPMFATNWAGISRTKLAKGAYHFFTLGMDGTAQAKNFMAVVPPAEGMLPPAIDLEFGGNSANRPTRTEFQQELMKFWIAAKSHWKLEPVIYTTSDFYGHYLSGFPAQKIWIREVIRRPQIPWTLWQYSKRGRVAGIGGFVDMDVLQKGKRLPSLD